MAKPIDAPDGTVTKAAPKSEWSDSDLLDIVGRERKLSIGFDLDPELRNAREQALNYYKGVMPDAKKLPGRSGAVSTDVSDAVETVLPDLMEIFTAGDDVAAFIPSNPNDEQAAQQETDYIQHVVFQDNDGFLTFYTAFKDALLEKIGVFKFWWNDDQQVSEEQFTGKTAVEMQMAQKDGVEILDVKLSDYQPPPPDPNQPPDPSQPPPMQLYDFTVRTTKDKSCIRIMAVAPEDFTVAPDTIALRDTTYCAMRARPRAQQLIADGFDADDVDELRAYSPTGEDQEKRARDTAGETETQTNSDQGDMRQVEIVEHFVRLINKAGEPEMWCVTTGNDETILLKREKASSVPFAAITPYPVAHNFYGRSLADLLLEIQRIKTALTRMLLDSGYFAMNQRVEVAMDQAGDYTIADLLRTEPGVPVRSKTGNAVRPIGSGELSFDAPGALEYFSTVAENRTGVVRNAQGLNPDTLHDTASGALALMTAAQRRVRLIARIFAETGIKDLFLGVHALIRENASQQNMVRLNGKWVPVDPTKWGERTDMSIEIGMGASGRQQDVANMQAVLQWQTQAMMVPGGQMLVTPINLFNAASKMFSKMGLKAPEQFVTDPGPAMQAQAQQPPQPPPPDPKMVQVQMEDATKRYQIDQENQLKQQQMQGEFQLKQYQIDKQAQVDATTAIIERHATPHPFPQVGFGGQPG